MAETKKPNIYLAGETIILDGIKYFINEVDGEHLFCVDLAMGTTVWKTIQ